MAAQVAPVNPPIGGFNIDGTLKANTVAGDWIGGTGTGGYVLQNNGGEWGPIDPANTKFIRDDYNASLDLIFTGGSAFGDKNVTSVNNPGTPSISAKTQASCSSSIIILQVDSPVGSNYEYNNNGGIWQTSNEFTISAGDGFSIKARINGSITCESNPATCQAEVAPSAKLSEAKSSEAIIKTNEPTVKAFPNPFRNTINFVIEVPESGNGSLELMNLMGQRVRTVFNGEFTAGKNTYEVSLPSQQTSTLIYVLWVGGKRLTGKLIQTK